MQAVFQVFKVHIEIKHDSCFPRADGVREETANKQIVTLQPAGAVERARKRLRLGWIRAWGWKRTEGKGRAVPTRETDLGSEAWDGSLSSTWRKAG